MSNIASRSVRYAIAAAFPLIWLAACETKTIPEDDLGGAGMSANAGSGNRAGTNSNAGMSPNAGDAGEAGEMAMPQGGSVAMGGNAGSGIAGAAAGSAGNAGSGAGAAVCGNNKVETGEECDDGNKKNGDGCSETCTNKCETCEKNLCMAELGPSFDDCFGNGALGVQPVPDGPGAGLTQAAVCQNLVSCARRTGCSKDFLSGPILSCLCGSDQTPAQCQEKATGPCAAEVAAAAYSLNFSDIAARIGKTTYPVGRAHSILADCDGSACRRECLQDKEKTACEACALGSAPTLYNFVCEDYGACTFDDQPAKCGTGEPKDSCAAKTCSPAAECALRTGCGAKDAIDCYADGNGPCADEFAKAANSTDSAVIKKRITTDLDGNYASRIAARLLKCESDNCKSVCFPGASGSGGSSASGSGGSGG